MQSLGSAAEIALGRQRSPQQESGPDMVRYLRSANVVDGSLDLRDVKSMNFTPTEQQRFSLRFGDVLVTEGSGSRDSVGASAVWRDDLDGIVCFQNTLLRLRPRPHVTDGRFLAWWARHAHASGLMSVAASGANILHLGAENLRRLPIDLPPLDVQRRIADFLDDQIGRMDVVLSRRTAQIEMLAERTIALVDDCLPTGDDPMVKLGHVAKLQTGLALNSNLLVEGGRSRPYLRVANVKATGLDLTEIKEVTVSEEQIRRHSLKAGDVLMTEGGDRDKLGRGTLWQGEVPEALHQNHVFAIRPRDERLDARYLALLTQSSLAREYFEATGNQSTNLASTNASTVLAFYVPLPSVSRQRERARRLSAALEHQSRLRIGLETSLAVIEERKRSLITAAVTGEFDVATASSRAARVAMSGVGW